MAKWILSQQLHNPSISFQKVEQPQKVIPPSSIADGEEKTAGDRPKKGYFGRALNSAGQSPTLLVYKTVHDSLPVTRLLNSLVLVIHTSHESGRGNVDAITLG